MTTDTYSGDTEGVETFMATLYLTEQYSVVKIEGEALRVQFPAERVSKQAGKVVRVPLNKVEQVMVLGDITLTTPALHALLERRIAVHYLSARGRSYGALTADWARIVACAWRNTRCSAMSRGDSPLRGSVSPASC